MKTDNHNLEAKLELRRSMLREFSCDHELLVLDCFSGAEQLWSRLRREFPVKTYLALDVKAKRGRLKMDSLRYLQGQRWTENVIDLDAYGSPWRHWFEVLKRRRSCLVFLTVGSTMFKNQQSEALAALGITFPVPIGLHAAVSDLVTQFALGMPRILEFEIECAREAANPGGNARYMGIRLNFRGKAEPRPGRKAPASA